MRTLSIGDWIEKTHKLGKDFAARAEEYDNNDQFVTENYYALKENGFLSVAIPEELGGGGISHSEMCDILRTLAQYCSSTALALSMHQHLLAANIWKFKQGQ
ncbi:MAG TPA: acyl-CoA dehydrogenase family protein, partial [Ignavibacteriaceae bacterium]